MTAVLGLLAAFALLVCFLEPREGVFVCLFVGFGDDLLRKVVPGEPVYYTALVMAFVGAVVLGALRRGLPLRIPLSGPAARTLRTPLRLFLLLIVFEAAIGFAATRSPVVAGIGVLAYLAPLPAVLVAGRFAVRQEFVVRFLWLYVVLSALFASGMFLSMLGSRSPLLDAVGDELVVYSERTGEPVRLMSGFFRSSEIAAWHVGAALCLLVVLWVAIRRSPLFHFGAGLLTLFLVVAILLTGRRKALALIVVFLAGYGFLLLRSRRGTGRFAMVVLFVAVAGALLFESGSSHESTRSPYQPYVERGATTTGRTAWERLQGMSAGSFRNIIEQNGVFGAGAGTGSQGSQYYGGGARVVGYAAEGGFGKVLAELGVPGLALMGWILVALVRVFRRFLRRMEGGDPARVRMSLGLMAFLGANLIEFTTTHQAFGDPFVLLMLGWIAGSMMALLQGAVRKDRGSLPAAAAAPPARVVLPPARPIEGIQGW